MFAEIILIYQLSRKFDSEELLIKFGINLMELMTTRTEGQVWGVHSEVSIFCSWKLFFSISHLYFSNIHNVLMSCFFLLIN